MWTDIFLSTYRTTGSMRNACAAAGVHRSFVMKFMDRETDEAEEFKNNFTAAQSDWNDLLEETAVKRAVEGIEKTIYGKDGTPIGYETIYSDTLLVKLMEGNMPEKYGKKIKVSSDTPVEVTVKHFAPAAP